MFRPFLCIVGLASGITFSSGCGLDWTLPTNHFDGVEEHGYVSYWEKIGEADLGDGLVIPANINFNSHRESSSPTLGKGWMVALLESHVEPIDENSMKVIMPDGWTFTFRRNGSSETWRGNAGWVGETNQMVFTITAPCGWRIKYDGGRIQEMISNKNRTFSYKYNGPVASEVDVDGKVFMQVDSNTTTGEAVDLVIGGQKITIAQARRPRIQTMLKENLVTNFDQSLNTLQWPDGKKETFSFGTTNKTLDPTMAIVHPDQTHRDFTWDAPTKQIKSDGQWTYNLTPSDNATLDRTNVQGQSEYYSYDPGTGTKIEGADGVKLITRIYVNSGSLSGKIRSITQVENGVSTLLRRYDYDESGRVIRALMGEKSYTFSFNEKKQIQSVSVGNQVIWPNP